MLGYHMRCWPTIKTTLGKSVEFSEMTVCVSSPISIGGGAVNNHGNVRHLHFIHCSIYRHGNGIWLREEVIPGKYHGPIAGLSVGLMLATVFDAGPALNQHWVDVSSLSGGMLHVILCDYLGSWGFRSNSHKDHTNPKTWIQRLEICSRNLHVPWRSALEWRD